MLIRKVNLPVVLAVLLATAGVVANAQTTYRFDVVPDGVWQVPANWTPNTGPPVAGDKAIIPNTHTCRVQAADRAAEIVQVDAGGTLVIETGRTLTIDTDGDGTNDTPKLTVNGDLKFEGTDATLEYGNTGLTSTPFVLDGSGTVLADKLPPGLDFQGR